MARRWRRIALIPRETREKRDACGLLRFASQLEVRSAQGSLAETVFGGPQESRRKREAKVPLDLAHSTAVDLRVHLASPLQAYPRHEVLYTKMAQNKRTRRF